jgi:ribonuclease R
MGVFMSTKSVCNPSEKMVKKFNKEDPHLEREVMKYENPVPSRELILELLEEAGRPMTLKQVMSAFDLQTPEEHEGIRRRLIAMSRDGQLISNRRSETYALVDQANLIRGVVQGHRDGFGFLIPDEGGDDLFLSAREMMTVFTDDVVLVRKTGQRGSKQEAVIVEVIERNTHQLVGRYFRDAQTKFVQPDNKSIAQDILIVDDGGFTIQEGDYVLINIVSQPNKRRHATGAVIEHLDANAPGMESRLSAYANGIPFEWSKEVLAEAETIPAVVRESDCASRLDCRAEPFVTIDGSDARDFDDAVLAVRTKNGWILKVAIADVAEYVTMNSALDKEAYNRGNSVYFPNEVIPMLPERLSNGICSLNPQEDRLVLICEMTINTDGVVKAGQLHEGVIHSQARLTYEQASDLLAGKGEHPLLSELQVLFELYQALQKQRKKRGTIEFEVDEPIFRFGEDGKIADIALRSRTVSHKIIEECMLAANVTVAKFLKQTKLPFLYRIHSTPSLERLEKLRDFLSNFALKLGGKNSPTAKDFSQLMEKVIERDDAHLIQTVVLRSMQQAVYSPENVGHFGLAYDSYCHFTSPIRRYPDLLVHRAIKHMLSGGQVKNFAYEKQSFQTLGEHLSITERRADRATREAMDRLKCEFMQDKVGENFSARIVDVTGFGLFVECNHIYVQGLLHISSLESDYYDHDNVAHCLRGRRGGKVYRLGDSIRVKVAKVDVDERTIDFVLQ